MKCINKDCDNEQDVDDLTICWRCYLIHYISQPEALTECLSQTLERLSE